MKDLLEMIRPIVDREEIRACAELMASSDPWAALYFTVDECESELRGPNVDIYGLLGSDGPGLRAFIATAEHGIGSEPLIEFLCVDASERGRGLGTALIEFAESEIFADADNIYLFVSDINPNAVRLYERLGFQRIGEIPDFNLYGQTEYFYRKTRRPRQERYREIESGGPDEAKPAA